MASSTKNELLSSNDPGVSVTGNFCEKAPST